ncbi:MAG: MerR family transcriptional regulator, heat shock protein HspR [Frankiaceae bacterium]|jgi:MerR family transcriptional regulator/heat shock protein HspR|nr:MerR family transcriptional regulator, heat shock protein HspR [Frankiaceae bacterium]
MSRDLTGDLGVELPPGVGTDTPVFVISVAATLAGMHPQTLRQYDRIGLVSPGRSSGRGRRYSARDILMLREVARLSQEEGINLSGIKRILELEGQVDALRARITELFAELEATQAETARREAQLHASYRRELVPFTPPGEITPWRRGGSSR